MSHPMTLGRTDLVLPITVPPAVALAVAVRSAAGVWPAAVLADGDDSRTYDRPDAVPFADLAEVLVFESAAARADLRRLGLTAATADRLVDVIAVNGELTVVVDDPADPAARLLIDTLQRLLRPDPANERGPA